MSDSATQRRLTPAAWLATGLGVGLRFPAPGTFGTLWGIPLWWVLSWLPSAELQWLLVLLLVGVGIPLCTRAAEDLFQYGWTPSAKDPSPVVWDELATLPLVYLFAPIASGTVVGIVVGFALHRLVDITKPWPCQMLEKLPAGWGIMLDDVAAALYAGFAYGLLAHLVL